MEGKALDTKSTHNSKAQLSEKYSPLWKCSKPFIRPQTDGPDGLIRFPFNIGCSEVTKKQQEQQQKKTNKKALQTSTRSKRVALCALVNAYPEHFTKKCSRHGQSTQKSPPWACYKGCAEDCADFPGGTFLLMVFIVLCGSGLIKARRLRYYR